MAITDNYGSKLPQPRVRKKDASAMVRERRMQDKCSRHCMMCGFRVRGVNHESGRHHQESQRVIDEKNNNI